MKGVDEDRRRRWRLCSLEKESWAEMWLKSENHERQSWNKTYLLIKSHNARIRKWLWCLQRQIKGRATEDLKGAFLLRFFVKFSLLLYSWAVKTCCSRRGNRQRSMNESVWSHRLEKGQLYTLILRCPVGPPASPRVTISHRPHSRTAHSFNPEWLHLHSWVSIYPPFSTQKTGKE